MNDWQLFWHQTVLHHQVIQDISAERMITICSCGNSWIVT